MVTLWKRNLAGGVSLALTPLIGFAMFHFFRNVHLPHADTQSDRTVIGRNSPPTFSGNASQTTEPVMLAALESFVPILPQFTGAAVPQSPTSEVAMEFRRVDELRASSRVPEAVQAYVQLIEDWPGTAQAVAADGRIDYLIELSTPEELDAMEAQLPPFDQLKTVEGVTIVAQFYFLRGMKCMESDPSRTLIYFSRFCEMAWDIMQANLDDPFKRKVLDAYLRASDALGRGDDARADLSALAATIPPCFTSWLIKTVVDDDEPPFSYVTTFEARTAVGGYYLQRALTAADTAEASVYFTKAYDAAREMLYAQPPDSPAFDLCHSYLEAACGLGEDKRKDTVTEIEGLLSTEPLSVMRWIVRYELAVHLTSPGRSEEETRAGFAHFGMMTTEAEAGIIDPAINDTRVDERTRGLLMCVLGHAFFGTNRFDIAAAHYQWVLDYYPHESHPGESAAYALVEAHRATHDDDVSKAVSAYEDFVAGHPSSAYSTQALARVAQFYEQARDLAAAARVYQRITREYPGSSSAGIARKRLDTLGDAR